MRSDIEGVVFSLTSSSSDTPLRELAITCTKESLSILSQTSGITDKILKIVFLHLSQSSLIKERFSYFNLLHNYVKKLSLFLK